MNLILASKSPRRSELLGRLTSDFVVVPSHIEEIGAGTPTEQAMDVAKAKARAVGRTERGVIVGADTIVVIGDEILGKPRSRDEAARMLRRLGGREHSVLTGLYVWNRESGEEREHCERTRVTFRSIDDAEIEAYLGAGEYHDKAGAYAIQGAAAKFILGINGDYTNVMGLPLCRVSFLLREVGVRL